MCGSALALSCGTRKSFQPTSRFPARPLAFGELAEYPPTLLTCRNSNCALTQEWPGPGKILQDILEITCSSKHFLKSTVELAGLKKKKRQITEIPFVGTL